MLSPRFIPCAVISGLALLGAANSIPASAQNDVLGPPPNIIVIQREMIKPGRAGAMHEASEAAFIKAVRDHHSSIRYLGMTSQSGPSRALFISGYPNMAAWEQESKTLAADPAMAADYEKAEVADGDLLTAYEQTMWRYRPDLSRKPGVSKGDRYMEIYQFTVHPGHEQDWEHIASMIKTAYDKADPAAHWDIFQSMFGTDGTSYLVIIPLKSMDDLDRDHAQSAKFEEAMGKEGMNRMDQLSQAAIATQRVNLFQFNPRMSYPPDNWVKADPAFWNATPAETASNQSGTH